jgi:23S rRNA (pseudouridine1915-N3)-methyltransferase
MKIQIVTVGKPKLEYAKQGFEEYFTRFSRLHTVHHIVIADKYAYDANYILEATKGTVRVILEITGTEYTSELLADFMRKRELESREVSLIIGGPEGLPQAVRDMADYQWSLGRLTLPHDLAMVVTLEALYRASTINARLPYHK